MKYYMSRLHPLITAKNAVNSVAFAVNTSYNHIKICGDYHVDLQTYRLA